MSGRYTSGPWSVIHATDIIGTENDPANGCVGTVDVAHVYLRTVSGRTEANARLIAAAPDLLDALKDVLAAVRYSSGLPETVAQFEEKLDRIKAASKRANAAIAKAEGCAE